MFGPKPALLLAVLLCTILCATALVRHTEKEREAMEARLNHQLKLFDRMDVEGWKSELASNAVIEGLGEKFTVAQLRNYFKKIGATHLKSIVTAPFSLSDWHGVFARTIRGRTKDGCTFNIDNVITLVKFNERFEIESWHDMWDEIESHKKCHSDEL